jgi:hypothetical protein
VWSLGCVILEVISGIPLWMSLKTLVIKKGKESIEYGLFAVKGRLIELYKNMIKKKEYLKKLLIDKLKLYKI